jgi:isoleucyl-tRNA synthetase
LTETVHQKLVVAVDADAQESVHFCDYPKADQALIDSHLEELGEVARSVVSLGRKIREEKRVKVRQPLAKLTVIHRDARLRDLAEQSAGLIQDELNVKLVNTHADESEFTDVAVKPNFKTLGKRCGKKLGTIKKTLETWGLSEVEQLESGQSLIVDDEALTLEDVILQRSTKGDAAVATDGNITVALDINLTEALISEGHAREFISQIQSARKAAGLEVSDRISLNYQCEDPGLLGALAAYSNMIKGEVLATQLDRGPATEAVNINGIALQISLRKA